MPPLSRRNFLTQLSAGAAGLTAVGSVSAAHLAGNAFSLEPKRYQKAVKLGMVGEGDTLLQKFELVKALGFDGIEPDSPHNLSNDELLAAQEKTGLKIHGVVDSAHWGKPFSHPDKKVRAEGVAALRTAIQDAKILGASTVLVVPAVVNKSISYADAWNRSQKEIAKVIPQAEEAGISIAFENVWNNFLLSPLEMARYIDGFESKSVGAYLDVGNLVRYAWPEHWVEALGHRIMKVDVKEYSRKKQNDEGLWKGFSAELHEGDCDWPAVMKALEKVGYTGWFTAEVSGGGRARLQKIAHGMNRIFTGK
jgi:L-ribulose-5-phosphate 3-epimerase